MTAAGDAGENVAKLVTPAQQAKSSTWPTSEMMALWREHGGSQHGPKVETATIPLHLLPRFMAAWVSRRIAEVLAERDRLAADLAAARADAEALRADKARLDFLDRCNARLNAQYGTAYRWRLVLNHNVNRLMLGHGDVDLHDSDGSNTALPSCREAIDEAIRAARTAGGSDGRS